MVHATHAAGFEGPLSIVDDAAIAELRVVLNRHGFAGTGVGDALGSPLPFGKADLRDDLPLYLHRLKAPKPINTLVKLFVLDQTVSEPDATAAFAPLQLARVCRMGLLRQVPGGLHARLGLSSYEGLIIAHDAYDEERRLIRADHVDDVNPATVSLSNLTVRRAVTRVLAIGTGCGALALKAARHARKVIATDTNPRALNVAAFNAAVNGITNVEWRLGSLFDAVTGERFDLIFGAPPSAISADTWCEEIVRRAPDHLEEGGFATFLINWGIHKDEEWSAPLRRWAEGNHCDTWMMLSASQNPAAFAAVGNRSRDRAAYADGLDRTIEYFKGLGFSGIGLGAVVLRRRSSGTPWTRADQLSDISKDSGAGIERLFDAQDRLAACDDAAMLAARYVVGHGTQLRQSLTVRDSSFAIDAAEVVLSEGLPFRGTVDAFATQLLARCDGTRALGDIASEIAREARADETTFTTAAAGIARRLMAMGFLVAVVSDR